MTTYSFTGAALFFDDSVTPPVPARIENDGITFDLVVPDGTTDITYFNTQTNGITLAGDITTSRLNGTTIGPDFAPDDIFLSRFEWEENGQARVTLFMEFYFTTSVPEPVSYGFSVIGVPLPTFDTVQDFFDFALTQVTSIGAPIPPYLPGTPIDLGVFNATVTEDDLIVGTAGNDVYDGGIGADEICGMAGDDQLSGGDGDDLLHGGPGADVLDGGDDVDTVSYAGATTRTVFDAIRPERNTGDAAGDSYASIENFIGSDRTDIIGGTFTANRIEGGASRDAIFGRGGDDEIFGQEGDDILLGGTGADLIDGGAGTDRTQYTQAATGVLVDLALAVYNTGEAAGDRFVSIEGIFGSKFDDELWGDGGANDLFGDDGDDRLFGRDGDDALFGGAGSDILAGGADDDVLRGGAAQDTFFFGSGADVIADWRNDFIRIDAALWGGGALSPGEILAHATAVGGDVVFDFGGGNTLTVENLADPLAIEPWLDSF